MKARSLIAAALAVLAGTAAAAQQQEEELPALPGMRQWNLALWPTGLPVSLFDLVEQGYELRAYQPGLERSWLYLQKGRKLYRCDSPEHDLGPPVCEELVKPY
jgi:hypothetical protein